MSSFDDKFAKFGEEYSTVMSSVFLNIKKKKNRTLSRKKNWMQDICFLIITKIHMKINKEEIILFFFQGKHLQFASLILISVASRSWQKKVTSIGHFAASEAWPTGSAGTSSRKNRSSNSPKLRWFAFKVANCQTRWSAAADKSDNLSEKMTSLRWNRHFLFKKVRLGIHQCQLGQHS